MAINASKMITVLIGMIPFKTDVQRCPSRFSARRRCRRRRSTVPLWRPSGVHATQHAGNVGGPLPAAGDVDRGPHRWQARQARQLRRLVADVGDLHVGRASQLQEPGAAFGRTQDARILRCARTQTHVFVSLFARLGSSHSLRSVSSDCLPVFLYLTVF